MENNLEKNREDSPPEVRLPIVSRELRQKAIIIAEFRTKLPRDSVVKPRVEPSSFTVETK